MKTFRKCDLVTVIVYNIVKKRWKLNVILIDVLLSTTLVDSHFVDTFIGI